MATTAGGEKVCLMTKLIHPVQEMLQSGIILEQEQKPLKWSHMLRMIRYDLVAYVTKTRNVSLL